MVGIRKRLQGLISILLAIAPPLGLAQPKVDVNADYECCNYQTGEIVGVMTMAQCMGQPYHVPKIPGNPGADKLCTKPVTPVTVEPSTPVYQDTPVWIAYKPNIPNGSFEEWQGDKPKGFGTYSKVTRDDIPGFNDFETVFRSSDALDGNYSMKLKNFKPDVNDLFRGQNVPAIARQEAEKIVISAGSISCREDCPLNTGTQSGKGDINITTLPISGSGNALCGAYKSNLVGGDTLSVSLSVRAGNTLVGGATLFDILTAKLSKATAGWTKFRIPIAKLPGNQGAVPDNGILQFQILPGGFSSQNPLVVNRVSKDSEVLIDSIHFCGGLDLQITDAESSGGFIVPEDKEASDGALAFVNLDNDDDDKAFDYQDKDGVSGGDNDLVQLLLQLSNDSKGTVELRQLSGQDKVRLWTANTKRDFEEYTDLGNPLTLPSNFRDNGTYFEKVIWVEGIAASENTGDIAFELIYIPEGGSEKSQQSDTVKLSVLAVDSVTWKGKNNNSEFDDNDLTMDPNHPRNEGRKDTAPRNDNYDAPLRVFPGKRFIGNKATEKRRNTLDVEITLNVKPPRETDIYLRVFDVDDPSANLNDIDDEMLPDDNRGKPAPDAGTFTASKKDWTTVAVSELTTTTEFQVTMQPGDNFRIAAGFDEKYLQKLANDDTQLKGQWQDGARIVDAAMLRLGLAAENAEIPDPGSWLSDTLTVWRFLHIERDSMASVTGNIIEGKIIDVVPGPSKTIGGKTYDTWAIKTNINIASQRPPSSKFSHGQADSFQGGELRLGKTLFAVYGNTAHGDGKLDEFHVKSSLLDDPSIRELVKNKSFKVEDDDFRQWPVAGAKSPIALTDADAIPLPPIDRLLPSDDNPYFKAYVFPRTDTIRSQPGAEKFLANIATDSDLDYIRGFFAHFDQADHEDDPDLWTVYLLGAYQGVHWEDADGILPNGTPVGGVAGEADGAGGQGAMIYWASGAELENTHQSSPGWRLIDAPAHEIGHLFGGEHNDGGLMSDGVGNHGAPSDFFSEATLIKIRRALHP